MVDVRRLESCGRPWNGPSEIGPCSNAFVDPCVNGPCWSAFVVPLYRWLLIEKIVAKDWSVEKAMISDGV